MNDVAATGGGIGAIAVGLAVLMYQIGRWRGGDPTPPVHFVAGMAIASLLFLGGGVLGAMGGAAAALGDSVGTYALEEGADVVAGKAKTGVTGGEKVAVGGVVAGIGLLALYLGLIKSGRIDLKPPLWRGAIVGVCVGASAGLLGMAVGVLQTSGNSVGYVLMNSI